MRMLSFLTKVVVFLLVFLPLFGFAVKNMDSVTVRYFLGLEWRSPLAFVLLVMFAIGIAAGILASLGIITRQRRELLSLKRELRSQPHSPAPRPVEAA